MQLIWDGTRLVESFCLDMNSIGLMGNYFANAARVMSPPYADGFKDDHSKLKAKILGWWEPCFSR